MRFRNAVLSVGLLCLSPFTTFAQAPATLDALLALPPSPGADALLVLHATDPRVPKRWREALTDPDPSRRASAARLLGATAAMNAIGGLRAAALAEKDASALGEMLQALVIIGSDVSDGLVYQRAGDVPPVAARRIAETLATVRPAGVVSHLLASGHFAGVPDVVADIYARLLAVAPQEAIRLEQGAAIVKPGVAAGLLRMAAATKRKLPAPVVVAALHGDVETAADALNYMSITYGRPSKAAGDRALVEAHAIVRRDTGPAAAPLHALLVALADRWITRAESSVSSYIPSIDGAEYEALRLSPAVIAVLTREERRELEARVPAVEQTTSPVVSMDEFVASGRWERALLAPTLLMADWPPAMVLDLAKVTGCRGPVDGFFDAVVTHRPDGRVQSAGLGVESLSEPCQRMAHAMVASGYGPPSLPKTQPARSIVRLDERWWSCLADSARDPAPLRVVRSRGVPIPKKVEDRKPHYPADALAKGVQGVVVIDATISPRGCVTDAKVMRSIPPLDLPALVAVAHWRYALRLDDAPARPVQLTVTVSFQLR
jgi:TonB family protein